MNQRRYRDCHVSDSLGEKKTIKREEGKEGYNLEG